MPNKELKGYKLAKKYLEALTLPDKTTWYYTGYAEAVKEFKRYLDIKIKEIDNK